MMDAAMEVDLNISVHENGGTVVNCELTCAFASEFTCAFELALVVFGVGLLAAGGRGSAAAVIGKGTAVVGEAPW